MEERTGRSFDDTAAKQDQCRKINGEAVYKSSPSVPDSMVQFAEENNQEERITRQQEIELGEKMQEAIRSQNQVRGRGQDQWCCMLLKGGGVQ